MWCFGLLALIAGGTAFIYRVGGLASYPRISAISGWDQSHYFFWLRSPLWGGEFDFTDDIRDCASMPADTKAHALHLPRTPNGHQPNKYGVGWAFVNTPFYLAADVLAHFWRDLSPASGPREDGAGPIYQLTVLLAQLGLAIASLFLATEVLSKWFTRETAALAVVATWLGSFLFLYQTYHLGYAHNTVFFALMACYASAHAFRRNPAVWLPWIYCGAAAGLLAITRYQTVIYLLYPVVLALQVLRLHRRTALDTSPRGVWLALPWLGRVGAAVAAFFAVASVQLIAWKIVYGSWLIYSYTGEVFYFSRPQLWAVLFSPYHGLFYWSPFLLAGFGGFIWWLFQRGAANALRRPEICWLISLLCTYWVNAAWETWWFGPAFGSRAFEGCILFFMAGGAFVLTRLSESRWRHAALAIAALMIMANLSLACAFARTWIPRDAPVRYGEMWQALLRREAVKP
ncbi:hypothetical protein AYO41_00245 [Verrucomicrobia bacterium SCGC AG-212-E04]|nr:hypothetical protein AYO41_00245 [Verrucomicrobia bacterium SCGC AG-212-E04]